MLTIMLSGRRWRISDKDALRSVRPKRRWLRPTKSFWVAPTKFGQTPNAAIHQATKCVANLSLYLNARQDATICNRPTLVKFVLRWLGGLGSTRFVAGCLVAHTVAVAQTSCRSFVAIQCALLRQMPISLQSGAIKTFCRNPMGLLINKLSPCFTDKLMFSINTS